MLHKELPWSPHALVSGLDEVGLDASELSLAQLIVDPLLAMPHRAQTVEELVNNECRIGERTFFEYWCEFRMHAILSENEVSHPGTTRAKMISQACARLVGCLFDCSRVPGTDWPSPQAGL